MTYGKTITCKDAKQLNVQKMTINRPQNHLKETDGLKDRQSSG